MGKLNSWRILTNHARILLYLLNNPTARVRVMAEKLGITERAVHKILSELEEEGYLRRRREGRRNNYQLNLSSPVTIDHDHELTVRALLRRLSDQDICRPAIFLDRDGTLIEDEGYISSPDDIHLFPDTISSLQRISNDFDLFVVTNQSGIAKGLVTADDVDVVNSVLDTQLKEAGIEIRRWYVCPHDHEDNCDCMKPRPRFMLEASNEFRIDLSRSFVIGDHPHDVLMGNEYGVTGLYLLTGHGAKHSAEVPEDKLLFHSIGDAISWLEVHKEAKSSLEAEIEEGVHAIQTGGLTAFPTETVYGLGADALDKEAVKKIFAAKQRPFEDPLISHVSSRDMVGPMVAELPQKAVALMDAFWPGPLTLVFKKSDKVPDAVTAGNPTVAIRMPSHPVALELIRRSGRPIAAPSANTFGKTSPTTAQHVIDQLEGKFDAIIDGGACRVGVESTVLSLVGDIPLLLRPGGITIEEIEGVIGPISVKPSKKELVFDSPGMFPSHYAPKTPMLMVDDPSLYAHETHIAIMLFKPSEVEYSGEVFILSNEGDPAAAAARLYETMRRIDRSDLRLIVAERLPETGMGVAVNDRMSRAATP